MTDERFLLIDGHSMAFRAFYALKPDGFYTKNGQYTNAVHGFLSTLLRLINERQPTHIAVAFDLPGGTFRTREYHEYKAGRKPTPEPFKGQVETIQQVLDVLGIAWLTQEDYEADDILATLSKRGEEAGMRNYIASGDKDSYQLVSAQTTVLYSNPRLGMQVLDPAGVEAKTGVSPQLYPDMAALVGEGADNIPGVPGVGPKTAQRWLAKYGDLEGILTHADEITGKVGQSLRDNIEQVKLNREINQLVRDLPLGSDLTQFQPRGVDQAAMHELFDTLEFSRLRSRVLKEMPIREGTAVSAATPSANGAAQDEGTKQGNGTEKGTGAAQTKNAFVPVDLQALEVSETAVAQWLEKYAAAEASAEAPSVLYGVYVRGTTDPARGEATGIAIASGQQVLLIDPKTLGEADSQALAAWLGNAQIAKVLHGAKEAWHALRGSGYALAGVAADTVLSAYLLHPYRRRYELGDLVLQYLGVDMERSAPEGVLPGLSDTADPDAAKAAVLSPLSQVLRQELHQIGENGDLLALELAVSTTLERMEDVGIAVDSAYLENLRENFDARVEAAARSAYAAIGHEVNLSSPKQLQGVLFDELNLPKTRRTKSGYTTNAEALADLAAKIAYKETPEAIAGQVFLSSLLEHRDAIKLRQSVEGLQRAVQADGRIHTTFQQAVAATGRLSSTDPNLQNIHARTEEGLQIREAFIAGRGYEGLMTADYSQIEMRIMASLSGDEGLIEAFNEGEDLHSYVASLVFEIPEEQVSSQQRSRIKAMSYGLAYGLSAYGLARQLHIGADEAKSLMDAYNARFGKVRQYLNSLVERARRDGYTETILGRRRYLPELDSPNRQLREASERMALNAPIQGSAADIIKIAMVQVESALREGGYQSRILLQVHDELVIEIAHGEREPVEEIVRREMGNAYELRVPLSVGVGYGDNWRAAAH
ncbi:DNA polymerase I [Actinobaculum suis]|uniref:DNA polymerase I n=1 Tax=Actinobaculum suis TaxID=1657 RepID=A0A7Z9C8K3_9ACTO|nr:DNA polymerase I [Actinobaculum suis]VDG76504.1 DNA polymerase I [Actinobaculum suis]